MFESFLIYFPVLLMNLQLFNPLRYYLIFFLFSWKLEIFETEATLSEEISVKLEEFSVPILENSPNF